MLGKCSAIELPSPSKESWKTQNPSAVCPWKIYHEKTNKQKKKYYEALNSQRQG
jgi:hypothetical protein